MIRPTVGRSLHFFPKAEDRLRLGAGPLAAILAHVHHERLINVGVFNPEGRVFGVQDVPLLQDDDVPPEEGGYCAWMDYQKGQAAKHDELEKKLADSAGGSGGSQT